MIDLRFPTALQLMLFLSVAEQTPPGGMTSAQLAKGMGLHSSFVRRLLAPLIDAGLVASAKGKAGGVRLARPVGQITLREIYQATLAGKKLWASRLGGPNNCLVSSNTSRFFEALAGDAEAAVLDLLGSRTLAESVQELERLAECPGTL